MPARGASLTVMGQESGIRNSRRDSTQEWAMPGQVQELQVSGTPRGGTVARVLARTLPFAGQYFSTPEQIVREPDGAEERSVPCPRRPTQPVAILQQDRAE